MMRTTVNTAILENDALWFDGIAADASCETATLVAQAAASHIRSYIRMGNIGEEPEEVEYEPLTAPAETPVPVTAPAEPVPA